MTAKEFREEIEALKALEYIEKHGLYLVGETGTVNTACAHPQRRAVYTYTITNNDPKVRAANPTFRAAGNDITTAVVEFKKQVAEYAQSAQAAHEQKMGFVMALLGATLPELGGE